MTFDGGAFHVLVEEVRADHQFLRQTQAKYGARVADTPSESAGPNLRSTARLVVDLVANIGFQQLAAFRVASMLGRAGLTPLAMIASRLIRHLYAAEMHWEADLAPGIALVHGNGLVISREARVGPRCVLFHNVTLGISSDPTGRGEGGAPVLHADVHVGPGANILGPIEIGPDSKVAGGTTVLHSVGPGMTVTAVPAVVGSRRLPPVNP